MRTLFERIRRAAQSEATVLIRGESGTGKELVARAMHDYSPRHSGPFRAVNCATFTGELLSSELFGHVRGAFTGAVADKPGLLSITDKGTLFLDEIAEMPLETQARLLRVLQDRKFQPLGSTSEQTSDVRLISATNQSLRTLVDEGRFRADLMYRVRVVVLRLPPLRERSGDIEALFWHFVRAFNARGSRELNAVRADAWEAIQAYEWPGNVRELKNNVEQAFALGEGPVLELFDLTPELQELQAQSTPPGHTAAPASRPPSPPIPEQPQTYGEMQKTELIDALKKAKGRKAEAAKRLGISRSTLWRRMRALGVD